MRLSVGIVFADSTGVGRNYVFALMLAVLGLYAGIAVPGPIPFVSSVVDHLIAYAYHPASYAIQSRVWQSGLTGIVGLLIAVRTLHPQRYRAVEQWIHAQR